MTWKGPRDELLSGMRESNRNGGHRGRAVSQEWSAEYTGRQGHVGGLWSSLRTLAGGQGTFVNLLAVNQKESHRKPASFPAHIMTNLFSVPGGLAP